MSASIITFANLGKKTNLGTFEIEPVISRLAKEGALDRVICQIHKDYYFKRTYSAIPPLLRYSMRVLEKLAGRTFPRGMTETLFDYFAQWRVGRPNVALFHGGHFLSCTLRRAHLHKVVVADLTRSAHFATNAALEREEIARLGLTDYEGTYAQMYRKHPHQNEFDYIIASSDFVRRSYIAAGYPADRIFIAHPDVDHTRFTPTVRDKRDDIFRVVYIAFTTPIKGLHYLLDAWESLHLPKAELVLVGGYGDMSVELVQRYNARIAGDTSIRWVGSQQEPEAYFRDTSAFVFPSLTEGFGKVTQEAMACGLPVITTENAQGLVEDGRTGFVVPIRDARAIADKIRYLYDNPAVAEQMGKEARKVVENKKPFGEIVYEIYQEILKREHKL